MVGGISGVESMTPVKGVNYYTHSATTWLATSIRV